MTSLSHSFFVIVGLRINTQIPEPLLPITCFDAFMSGQGQLFLRGMGGDILVYKPPVMWDGGNCCLLSKSSEDVP